MGPLLTNVRINRTFSAALTCFISPRKRLLGDANTSSSKVFHSKVNASVPGRHGFILKTGSETPSRRNAGFCLKVKMLRLRFFLRTVIWPNETNHACCQTNFQKSFFRLVYRKCALMYIKYLKNRKQMCQYFQKHPVFSPSSVPGCILLCFFKSNKQMNVMKPDMPANRHYPSLSCHSGEPSSNFNSSHDRKRQLTSSAQLVGSCLFPRFHSGIDLVRLGARWPVR